MSIENEYPDYKNPKERQEALQNAYTDLQITLYNKKQRRKSKKVTENKV